MQKGAIQNLITTADQNGNGIANGTKLTSLLTNLGVTPKDLIDIGLNPTNTNDVNSIIASLRKFKNLKIGSRRLVDTINPKTILGHNVVRKSIRSSTTRTAAQIRYPWLLVDSSQDVPVVVSTMVPGFSENRWSIDWVRNSQPEAFPLSQITSFGVSPNNSVKSQTVGKVCSARIPGLSSRCSRTWMSKSIRDRYAYIYNSANRTFDTYKNGVSGLSVDQLAKIIVRIGKTNSTNRTKARADFIELKRNGDYGEIYTLYYLNLYETTNILKPGDLSLAYDIVQSGGVIPPSVDATLGNNFYFNKGCFWSTDRPAIFLCILEDVPFVRTTGRTYHYNLGSPKTDLLTFLSGSDLKTVMPHETADTISQSKYDTACDIVQGVINDRYLNNPVWFYKLCVIDSAHDFGHDSQRAKTALTFQQREMIKNVLIAIGSRRSPLFDWGGFVNSVWAASSIEYVIGKLINRLSTQTTKDEEIFRQDPNNGQYTSSLHYALTQLDMCIMWDSGSSPPGLLAFLVALAAAKFLDPAA